MSNNTSKTEKSMLNHVVEWRSSAVNNDIIERNVWRIEDSRELDELLNRNTSTRWKHSDDLVPGWAVAGVDTDTGERTFKGAQFKPDRPLLDPQTGKTRKYLSASRSTLSPLFLGMADTDYWRKLKSDFTTPLIITEGAKKAGAILSAGFPGISLPGVATGGKLGRLRPELAPFCRYGRRIFLAFDRDILHKRQVQNALHNLGRMLAANGSMVYVLEWQDSKKGIDDYLVSGGHLQDLVDNAKTLEEWRDELEDSADPLTATETCRLADRYQKVSERLKGRLRWNALKGEVELDNQPVEIENLRIFLALKFNLDIPLEDCNQIINYIAKQQTFNPVAEYLHQCAKDHGPDSELLDSIAETYLGATSELHRTFIRKTLIAAVARALAHGCKLDTVCILTGPQGVGKSSFWKILAGEWFDDSVGSPSDKDERLKLHQCWFVEWAELESVFKRKDISAVKAFITTGSDMIRPPYARLVREFPRPSIIVGTTNHHEFLGDSTGNRRFWVVPVSKALIPFDMLTEDRDRIWGAAVCAFMGGETWTLTQEMTKAALEASRDYELSDPWENPVMNFVNGLSRVTIDDILLEALHLDVDRQERSSQMRVSNLLKANGWTTRREVVHGRRQRLWFPPVSIDEVVQVVLDRLEVPTNLCGQPTAQPTAQPLPNLQENPQKVSCQLEMDNLPNLDNLDRETSREKKNTLCYASNKLYTSEDFSKDQDILIFVESEWKQGKFVRGLQEMVYSPKSRALESGALVKLVSRPFKVAIDCILPIGDDRL